MLGRNDVTYSYDRTRTAAAGGPSFSAWWEMISMKASGKVRDLDETLVGTPDYMGIAYFWDMEYKFDLRDQPPNKLKAVHDALLKAKLPLDGTSPEHEAIIKKIVG